MINITNLVDDEKCYETVRKLRWHDDVCCPKCNSFHIIKYGL